MKIVRRIAATLALCGTAFFTNMAHAGECGYWETEGFWSTPVIGVGTPTVAGGPVGPPATGPGTPTFITTGATFVEQSCGGAADNGGTDWGAVVSNGSGIVEMNNGGEDITSPVDALKAAARRGVSTGYYFSFCNPGPDCVRWLRTSPATVTLCQPISPTSNCK